MSLFYNSGPDLVLYLFHMAHLQFHKSQCSMAKEILEKAGKSWKSVIISTLIFIKEHARIFQKNLERSMTQRTPWILANKINHEQKQDVPVGL